MKTRMQGKKKLISSTSKIRKHLQELVQRNFVAVLFLKAGDMNKTYSVLEEETKCVPEIAALQQEQARKMLLLLLEVGGG